MNLSDIRIIFVVVGLVPLLILTGETNPFNNNSNNLINIANQFAYAQKEEYNIKKLLSSVKKFNSNSSNINQQQNNQQQQNKQEINIIRTDDLSCETPY